jgi:hypothetical protein
MTTTESRSTVVAVTLVITNDDGSSQTTTRDIASGATKVVQLKAELGVPADSALWVIEKSGKKHQLGDHESHNVKAEDRYEAIVRGGVS